MIKEMNKLRKMHKQPDCVYDEWNFGIEPNMRLYDKVSDGYHIYDTIESSGYYKSRSGELYPRLVKKNGKARIGILKPNGIWYWK